MKHTVFMNCHGVDFDTCCHDVRVECGIVPYRRGRVNEVAHLGQVVEVHDCLDVENYF